MTRKLILLVTDDRDLRSRMTEALEALAFDVVTAVGGDDAVVRLRERQPALVCVDMLLPRGSGYDVVESVRGEGARGGVPIVMMGDSGTPKELADAEEAGANGFLRKPFSTSRLRRTIDALLLGSPNGGTAFRHLRPSEPPGSVE